MLEYGMHQDDQTPRHIEEIIDISGLVNKALDEGDGEKAIKILLDAVLINNQNLERCAAKLNELIVSLNAVQTLLDAVIGSANATKH